MTHHDPFVQAILEDPDNDSLRLIYADWLEERGDPRGEFIRVQIALANAEPGDEQLSALCQREEELLAEHRRTWLGPLHSLAYRWDFRRGLPEEATIRLEDFLQNADTLFRAAPLRLVRLMKSVHFEAELAACPYLLRLRGLHLTNNQIGDGGLKTLLASPYLGEIRSLRLGDAWLTENSGQTLAGARNLKKLTSLSLTDNLLGDRGAALMAMAPHFSRLTDLYLGNNQITFFGAHALAESPHLRKLKTLDLGNIGKQARHGPNTIDAKGRELLLKRFTAAVCTL